MTKFDPSGNLANDGVRVECTSTGSDTLGQYIEEIVIGFRHGL